MDLISLGPVVQRLLQAGLAPSTQRTYAAGKKKYLGFCQQCGVLALPITEQKLLSFVAFMSQQGLKYQTMKCYLSAVRHLQVTCGGGDPKVENMPLLELALRGTRKEQSGIPKRTRLPITPGILRKMLELWNREPTNWNHRILWAACCVGFIGFLRSGELTAPEKEEFDASQHLTFKDIAVDNTSDPKVVSIHIKQSKTDPFRQGVTIFLGRTNTPICPVAALLSYLAARGAEEGPLFRFEECQPLTRSRLVKEVRQVLQEAGV